MCVDRSLILGQDGLSRFLFLREEAVESVTRRFYDTFPDALAKFGERGRQATLADLTYHLEFLRPVLEHGILQPFAHYLRWLASILASRSVPSTHLPLSLDWMAEFFVAHPSF